MLAAVDGEGGELLLDVEDVWREEARGDVRQGGEDLGPALKEIRTPVVHFSEVQDLSLLCSQIKRFKNAKYELVSYCYKDHEYISQRKLCDKFSSFFLETVSLNELLHW